MNKSDTPRTDAVLARDWKRTSYTKAGELERLCCMLERELAAKDATIDELWEALDRLAYQANIVAPTVGLADAISNANRLLAALAKVTP